MNDLYRNIRERRLGLKLSQSQLAEKIGYADKTMISHIESGQIDLPISRVIKIAEVLKISPVALMGYEREESKSGQLYEDDEGIKAQMQTNDVIADDKLKVGDEVDVCEFVGEPYKAWVTNINNDSETVVCMRTDGSSTAYVHPNKVTRTGRFSEEIAKIFTKQG